MQKTLQTENVEDTEGLVSGTLEMQNLKQALHEHRAQLAEKTNQIDSYKQVVLSLHHESSFTKQCYHSQFSVNV